MLANAAKQRLPMNRPNLVCVGGSHALPPAAPTLPLILRLRESDPLASDAYLAYFWPMLQQEVRRYGRLGAPADDLQGEGSLALWEAAFTFDPRRHRTSVSGYVENQVHRRVRQAYRKAMGYDGGTVLPLERLEHAPAGEAGYGLVEAETALAHSSQSLPLAERTLLNAYLDLVLREGLGPDQAAVRLAQDGGATPAAVKKRLQRTRAKLRETLA